MIRFEKSPEVSIGILSATDIEVNLKGFFSEEGNDLQLTGPVKIQFVKGRIIIQSDCNSFIYDKEVIFRSLEPEDCFTVFNVRIGIGFHWQKDEHQTFKGALKIMVTDSQLAVINLISVEDYLTSVISSEMSANSSAEMLKAHAVISRGWLLAQIEKRSRLKRRESKYITSYQDEKEIVRWYDREDHNDFDVCADDHCQRYQGITRATRQIVENAVMATCGEVMVFDNELCDTRFSKCCGGITEKFNNVWEPVSHPYLQRVYDNNNSGDRADMAGDLSDEENARRWILSDAPAFCNTRDHRILSQVLNDYDQKTHDFYRWVIGFNGRELGELIKTKTGIDFGNIYDLVPVERGVSGRLIKLKISGSKKTMVIGKELEIRKALSKSHLYSSAFVVDKTGSGDDTSFTLHGAGWGHGVGLCQIGAAVMGEHGYTYGQILLHYFRGAELKKIY